ncbi:MAG TPA: PAS domain-containing sensor histidine kinase [Mycobacteriales bacterium]|nr:PAS domain-containing sensor histidine kinase [Mycobacteriales bacterium]
MLSRNEIHKGHKGGALLDVYDDLPDGVLVAGPDGRVTTLNHAGRRLLGTTGDPRGLDYRDLLPLLDAGGVDWWGCITPYRGLRTRSGHPERLLELRGTGRELLVTARFVREVPGGPVIRLVVAFRDDRARRRAERDRSDLVSTVAHEIRSPLTTVKGFTATLLTKWDRLADSQKKAMLAAINADADRVTRLLSDLLDASRIDAGRLRLRTQVVDVPQIVRAVFAGRVAAGDPPDRFLLLAADGLPDAWLDPDRVTQVVSNLVENAVRHGAGTVSVEVLPAKTATGAEAVELIVSDEGTGIDEVSRSRIFSRFWRDGRNSGHGLGLYIVKGIVGAHHGDIEVDSAPGGGARFRVLLPAGAPSYPQP